MILQLLLRGGDWVIHDLHIRVRLRHQVLLVQQDLRGLRHHAYVVDGVPVLHRLGVEENASILRPVWIQLL